MHPYRFWDGRAVWAPRGLRAAELKVVSSPGMAANMRMSSNISSRLSSDPPKDELQRLRKENEALKKGASSGTRIKVSEKGAGTRDSTKFVERRIWNIESMPEIFRI